MADHLQNNVRVELCTSKENPTEWDLQPDGTVKFTVEDKTQPLATAHIFYTGYVKHNEDAQVMCNEMFESWCEWWAKNRNEVVAYFSKVEHEEIKE